METIHNIQMPIAFIVRKVDNISANRAQTSVTVIPTIHSFTLSYLENRDKHKTCSGLKLIQT